MTDKRLPIPKYYYGLDGNIRDEKYIYETKTMPKRDIDELFYDEKHLGSNSLIDLLNELHEENQSLKFQLGECRNNKLFSRRQLEKENEQLKSSDTITDLETEIAKLKTEIDTYKAGNKTIHERLKTLHEENTHIKNTIQTMIKNERTQMGQSVLQQLWEQIQ